MKKKTKERVHWIQRHDGLTFRIPWRGWIMRCCHCSLVHRLTFTLRGKQLWLTAHVDEKLTRKSRRTIPCTRCRWLKGAAASALDTLMAIANERPNYDKAASAFFRVRRKAKQALRRRHKSA